MEDIIVLKFGGSSVADNEKLKIVADKITNMYDKNNNIVRENDRQINWRSQGVSKKCRKKGDGCISKLWRTNVSSKIKYTFK